MIIYLSGVYMVAPILHILSVFVKRKIQYIPSNALILPVVILYLNPTQ